jgi:hypothetical protein
VKHVGKSAATQSLEVLAGHGTGCRIAAFGRVPQPGDETRTHRLPMVVFYWIMAALLAVSTASALLFFVLHLSTGEEVPRQRAVASFRWVKAFALLTFNVAIWRHVVLGFWALF